MRILMAVSEAAPFIKTGGLADVVSALSLSLAQDGHRVRIALPLYCVLDRTNLTALDGALSVSVGGHEELCTVYKTQLPGSNKKNPVVVYCIDHECFSRSTVIYGTATEPVGDNPFRFTLFSRAVFQLCEKIKWYPDVLHAHDWQTALVPVFLKYTERHHHFAQTRSLLTIHNLAFQCRCSSDNFLYTELDPSVFSRDFEFYGAMNILKAGISSADKINTVSPTYAQETKTQAFGCGLDGLLQYRSADYSGIVNGIDTAEWNPAHDSFIPKAYSHKNWRTGKAQAKEALQDALDLPRDPYIPLIGWANRLSEQKGIGECFGAYYGAAYHIVQNLGVQMAVVADGEPWCEKELEYLSRTLDNFKAVPYKRELEHLLYAGSDLYLMPSSYEPCGLSQLYALQYGTVPLVRKTGGLTDTVENYNQNTGSGSGFVFNDLTPSALYRTVEWAVETYKNRPKHFEALRVYGMQEDFSWKKSVKEYSALYEELVNKTTV
ncbi:MAG: glycogen synthase [Spirochaetaceae bacterium]|nr:glycogen synthase [Spirochaetaceae bacterium]